MSDQLSDQFPPLTVLAENEDPYTAYTISETKIKGLLVFERKLYPDNRGSFQELGRTKPFEDVLGRSVDVRQWALSFNHPLVLRGLHAEPQDKMITVWSGVIFVAISDIRPDSETFGQYVTFTFDQRDREKPKKTLFVSNGLANSFMVLGEQDAEYFYAVSEGYTSSEGKRAIRWNDPDINIPWPQEPKILSEDDANKHPFLRDVFPEKFS